MPQSGYLPFNATRAPPSKVYSFPLEILGQIFEECLLPLRQRLAFGQPAPPFVLADCNRSSVNAPMPLTLCHICSYWRNAAFSTPQLWNYLFHTAVIREVETEMQSGYGVQMEFSANGSGDHPRHDSEWPKPISLPKLLPLQKSMNIRKKDLDFLRWWDEKVKGDSLALRLKLHTELVAPSALGDIVTLGDYLQTEQVLADTMEGDISFLPNLISRARYLDIDPEYHSILADQPLLCSPTLLDTYPTLHYSNLESLVLDFNGPDEDIFIVFDNHFWHIPFEIMPKLRKICVVKCVLFDPFVNLRSVAGKKGPTMWKQLTHLFLRLETTTKEWRRFLTECTALQKAHFLLDISSHPPPFNASVDLDVTIFPNLKELGLVLHDTDDNLCFPYLLDGTHFPSLDALLLRGNSISLTGLHRLLGTAPELKRLRLHLTFPSQVRNLRGNPPYPPSFPYFEADFAPGSTFSLHTPNESKFKRLSYYVPHLELLMIDLPQIGTGTYIPYVRSMVRSGWLNECCMTSRQDLPPKLLLSQPRATLDNITNFDPHSNFSNPPGHPDASVQGRAEKRYSNPTNRRLKVDLFWKWNKPEASRMWPMITELKGFLQRKKNECEGFEDNWGPGLDVAVQVKYDPRPVVIEEDQEYWEMWFDHSFEF